VPGPALDLITVPRGGNPFLEGNQAPVGVERSIAGPLAVDGAIPPELCGLLVRNGPNPATVEDPHHYSWLAGDGMVHAVELDGGRALGYTNRWIRTRKLAASLGLPPPAGPDEPLPGPANINVIAHGGRILALGETGFPLRLDRRLETLCVEDFEATLVGPMTGHPRVDPDTGALVAFGYDTLGPSLRYFELDAAGTLVHRTEVGGARATMQHDFAVTATRVAFLDLPVLYDADLVRIGSTLPFRWRPDAGARIGILDRFAEGASVRWVPMEPCFAFHVMNAFDDGHDLVIDLCRYDRMFDGVGGVLTCSGLPALERWRIAESGVIQVIRLDDLAVEMPRINEARVGRPYRYGYCVAYAGDGAVPATATGLVRYDLSSDEALHFTPGGGRSPGEPVFVAAPGADAEDEGWILTVVYDPARALSDLVILDATAFSGPPVAVVHLPARVPTGFHGSFVPAAAYR